MERELLRLLPYLLGGTFAIGVLLLLLSLYLLRRRRTGAYWRQRRRAGERGGRLFLVGAGLIGGALLLTLISGLALLISPPTGDGLIRGPEDLYGIVLPSDAGQTATRDAFATDAQIVTETRSAPVVTPVPTQPVELFIPSSTMVVPTLTLTPTLLPTRAPSATLDLAPLVNTNTPQPTQPPPHLRIDAASSSYVEDVETPRLREFPVGVKRIYLYISFENMNDGVSWSRALYRDGTPTQSETQPWNLGAGGNSSFSFDEANGYEAGDYEVRVFVGDQEASRYPFVVRG
ncbi:MAG: hypothetical protein ABI835_10855 [Chloroflexota bacterium]